MNQENTFSYKYSAKENKEVQVIGSGMLMIALGILLGIAGMVCMVAAYPIYRSVFSMTKSKYTPRILELTEELSSET